MGHKHSVYDSDAHFSINPITKVIKNESSKKTTLVQGDHNSERFSFDIPRFIEGHDMMQCNLIEVHYDNMETGTDNISSDFYEVKDMQISPDDANMVVFSWLIIDTATKYAGSLEFSIKFKCMTGDVCDYKWNTGINTDISVSAGKDNSGVVVERAPNVVDQWRNEIFGDAENAVANINLAEQEAIEAIQAESEAVINAANTAEQNVKNVLANAIKGNLSGEIVTADDVSPVEHEIKARLYGKNQFNMSLFEATTDSGHAHISAVSDSSITVTTPDGYEGSGNCGLLLTLKELCTSLKAGRMYVLSGESPSSNKCIYLRDTNVYWNFGTAKTLSEDDINSKIAVYGFSVRHGDGVGDCIISNIQIEEGETVTAYEPYIDPATVNVRRCGKNLFPMFVTDTTFKNGSYTKVREDGSLLIHNAGDIIRFDHTIVLPAGDYIMSNGEMVETDKVPYIILKIGDKSYYQKNKFTLAESTECLLTIYGWNEFTGDFVFYPQLEMGDEQTDFEPYKGTEHTPSSDGTVSGMMSTSPNMTILTDTEGVVIDCEYIKDTNKVIQKLANALGIEI